MAKVKTSNANYTIVVVAMLLFGVSIALTLLAGVSPGIALVWNMLSALYISYDIIPTNILSNPLILASSFLDAIVFALFAVFLATWFIDVIRSINIEEYFTLRKVRALKNHIIVAPYNNFSKVLVEELRKEKFRFVVIVENPSQAAQLYAKKIPAVVGELRGGEVLKSAGIERASSVIACDDDDVKNALISIAAKDANPGISIISRVVAEENMQKLGKAGASRIVIPEVTAGTNVGEELLKRVA